MLILVSAAASPAHAADHPWSLTAFAGRYDDAPFLRILTFDGGEWEDAWIGGLALNRRFATTGDLLDWELESSFYQHTGLQTHGEVNFALVARWTRFPWDRYLDSSLAIGEGVSWASRHPPLEGETRKFLNHLLAEIELTPLPDTRTSMVLRVHHRSGVFGLYGAHGGSNFVTLGLRWRF